MEQKYSSAATSLSVVNKVYTQYKYKRGSIILDYGGGKYDKNVQYMLEKYNSKVLVYDPFNRSVEHNKKVMLKATNLAFTKGIDYIVCSNVLNVIAESSVIYEVLRNIRMLSGVDTEVLITIYEGDGTGVGKKTTKGWQRNEKTANYLDICRYYFDSVEQKRGIIHCKVNGC